MKTLINRKSGPPSVEDRRAVGDQLTRITSGYKEPLRVQWDRLSDDEQRELIALTRKADAPGSFSLTHLSKRELARFEQLFEKGAARPGFFSTMRDDVTLRREAAAIVQNLLKPPRRVALAEPGSVTFSKRWAFEFLRDGILWPAHVALLEYLVATWENGALPVPSSFRCAIVRRRY